MYDFYSKIRMAIRELRLKSLFEFFVCCDSNKNLPFLPDEIKTHIINQIIKVKCDHGCGHGKTMCCVCSDERKRDELSEIYVDGIGDVKKKFARNKFYCPECKKIPRGNRKYFARR